MNRPRLTRSVIPNLFTSMNMFCGFLSVINASEGKFVYSAWLILIAAVFDALDGAMARLTNSSSELGVELDSLSDVISFGAAPSFLIYQTYLHNFNSIGVVIASCLMIAGGFRLARFNIQLVGFDKTHFKGLPIPSSAGTIAAFVITFFRPGIGFNHSLTVFIIPLVLSLSFLMVSTIKYDTLPKLSLKGVKEHPIKFAFLLVAAVLFAATAGKALFYIFVFMIVFGIFRHILYAFAKKS